MKSVSLFYAMLGLRLVAPALLQANEAPADWTATCQGTQPFTVAFHSKSGEAFEDDMNVYVNLGDKKIKIPLPLGMYVQRGAVSEVKNLCDEVAGFDVGKGKVLLWLSSNSRPGWDRLNLVLFDLGKGTVLDMEEQVGSIKDVDGHQKLAIRPRRGEGYEVRLEREWMQNTATDTAENSIEDWMTVRITGNKIQTRWSR